MKLGSALALGLALSFGLACEGLRPEANAEAPVWKNRAGWVLDVEYTRDILAKSRTTGEPYERGEPEIDVDGRRIFVGSSDGGMYALSAPLGDIIWRFETLSFVQSSPLYEKKEDVLYFGSHDGALYKVQAKSGKLLWRLSTGAEVARRPVLQDGVIYFANANDTLVAADAQTGQVRWSQHRTPAMGMEVAGYSGPAVRGGLVFMGFSDGTVSAFDSRSGEERWQPLDLAAEAEASLGEIPTYLDVDTTPEIVKTNMGTAVIFGSYEGGVYALDSEVGTVLWSNTNVVGVTDIYLWEQPAYLHDGVTRPERRLLLISTGTTGMWALDPEDGNMIWQRRLPMGSVSRPAAVAGAIMMNASQLGTFLLSPIDGSVIDGIHFEAGASGTPAAYGRHAYFLTNGGNFLALRVNVPSKVIEDPASYHRPLDGF